MKKIIMITIIIGIIIILYSLILTILFHNPIGCVFFVSGAFLFFSSLNYHLKNQSTIKLLQTNKPRVLRLYLLFLAATILIEIAGRIILHLWVWPNFDTLELILYVILIGYPISFFFYYELFILIKKGTNMIASIITTTIIAAIALELPNTFAWGWIYTIPYINLEILKVNIVVWLGWIILIAIPLIANKIIK